MHFRLHKYWKVVMHLYVSEVLYTFGPLPATFKCLPMRESTEHLPPVPNGCSCDYRGRLLIRLVGVYLFFWCFTGLC
jgi:hypothetical protein